MMSLPHFVTRGYSGAELGVTCLAFTGIFLHHMLFGCLTGFRIVAVIAVSLTCSVSCGSASTVYCLYQLFRTIAGSALECICASLDGELLTFGGKDRVVRIWWWNRTDGWRVLNGHQGGIISLDISSSNGVAVSSSCDNLLRV